jgi:hypothetical protein
MRARLFAASLVFLVILAAGWMTGVLGAADSDASPPIGRTRSLAAERSRTTSKPRRRGRFVQPRIVPSPDPQFLAVADPFSAKVHDQILVTVRLQAGSGAARRAAFHLTTDPSLLRYVGPRITGGGALLVQPSSVEGELVIYRSSVPEGFAQTESLVELEYEAISPGDATVLLTEARLFDASSKELKASYESGSLVIE